VEIARAVRRLLSRRRQLFAFAALTGTVATIACTAAAVWATWGWRIGAPLLLAGLTLAARDAYRADVQSQELRRAKAAAAARPPREPGEADPEWPQ
jgi:hypothetical protein